MEAAIREYSEDQQVEFDTEPVKTKVTKTNEGAFKIEKAYQFIKPEDRFMVRFVKSFYNYLLTEASPANEKDFMPSERYYAIIANMLQRTWFFYHQRHQEWFILQKVKQWHDLGTGKK